MPKITLDHLSYARRGKEILRGISFTVQKGERLALLGPNGAGKTTLFCLLTDVIKPDKGSVYFGDHQTFAQVKHLTGVLWDNLTLFPYLKVKEVIRLVSAMYGLTTGSDTLYACLELDKLKNSLMQSLSRGERKRVLIYLAMLPSPELLILDEPTAELDPFMREKIWNTVFLNHNRTLVFSTHQWEEAALYATRIAFLHDGKLVCPPCTREELFTKAALTKKIVVDHTISIPVKENVCHYEEGEYRIFLFTEATAGFIDTIRQTTSAYSELPVGLKDVYQYLISTSR